MESWQRAVSRATVKIYVADEFVGSGAILTKNLIATASHVLDAGRIPIREAENSSFVVRGEEFEVQCRLFRVDGDAALLQVPDGEHSSTLEDARIACNDIYDSGDDFWSSGFLRDEYGIHQKPVSLTAVGDSFLSSETYALIRASGVPVNSGMSGAPVFNRRTGGIVGLLRLANKAGQAEIQSIAHYLKLARSELNEATHNPSWLNSLTDAQVIEGQWPRLTEKLRGYLEAVSSFSDTHPYRRPFNAAPSLSAVYVRQSAEAVGGMGGAGRGRDSSTTVPIEDLLRGGILVGAPGGGKSSAFRHLAKNAADLLLSHKSGTVPSTPIPILVSAYDLESDLPFMEALTYALETDLALTHPLDRNFLTSEPAVGCRWHLFLDGLDEVLDPDARSLIVLKAAKAFGNAVTVGTRALPEDEMQRLASIVNDRVWQLSELDDISSMMFAWLGPNVTNREQIVAHALEQSRRYQSEQLMRNPLMLSLYCEVIALDPTAIAPRSRTELYGRYLSALMDVYHGSKKGQLTNQARSLIRRDNYLVTQSVRLFVEGVYEYLGHRALDWIVSAVAPNPEDMFRHSPVPTSVEPRVWLGFMEQAVRRSGVVAKFGPRIRFTHQTIAEHLAAVTLEDIDQVRQIGQWLMGDKGQLQTRQSFLRFASDRVLGDDLVAEWIKDLIDHDDEVALDFISTLVDDGVGPQLGQELISSLKNSLKRSITAKSSTDKAIRAIQLIGHVATSAEIDRLLRDILAGNHSAELQRWSLVTLAGLEYQAEGLTVALRPDLPSDEQFELAVSVFSSDKSVQNLSERLRGSSPSTVVASLRALLPRVFSSTSHTHAFAQVLDALRGHHPSADVSVVKLAFSTAEKAHAGQKGRSGEPYISYPVAVAKILAELGLGPKTIAAALLYQTIRFPDYPHHLLVGDFGEEIAMIADGVAKLDMVTNVDALPADAVRGMVVAMSKDIRVIIIKLADRLQNARTLGFVEQKAATRSAQETLEVYAPLAHRLGLKSVKLELEDLSFAVLHPQLYVEIENLVRQRTPQREEYVLRVIETLESDLQSSKTKRAVSGRPKQYYEIYQDMIIEGREFDDIYDLVQILVLTDSIRDCYAVLGVVHARWNPMPGRFKDYIATPTFSLYQSLHTTVFGPGARPVEIKIRTHEMHQRAEFGVAAYWKRNESMRDGSRVEAGGERSDTDMSWLAFISDWQEQTSDPADFIEYLRNEVGAKEVYVFTPGGMVVGLPAGSTPVDFAYAVHTELGHRTMGAKVNGRLVPLESELASGDVVEVFTSKSPDAGPNEDWLRFAKSRRARARIRSWFAKRRRNEGFAQRIDAT